MVELLCENSQRVKAVGCFRRVAPSLMFNGVLNATLSEEKVSTIAVRQGNLELPCVLILLLHTKRKKQ